MSESHGPFDGCLKIVFVVYHVLIVLTFFTGIFVVKFKEETNEMLRLEHSCVWC
jgi:hypothetical protein